MLSSKRRFDVYSHNRCLEFAIPGCARSTGRIESWSKGFNASLVRSDAITAHLPSVPIGLFRTISRYPNLVDPTIAGILANNMPQDENQGHVLANDLTDSIRDVYRMAEALRIDRPDEALARCRTLSDLEQLHDRWVDRINRRGQMWVEPVQRGDWADNLDPTDRRGRGVARSSPAPEDDEFPNQPFPDSTNIKAITSAFELSYEGRLQRNCAGSYRRAVTDKELFVYKVLWPHRATLELRNTPEDGKSGSSQPDAQ